MKTEKFKKNWSFETQLLGRTEKWKKAYALRAINFLNGFKKGLTLNICCGLDKTGDILVDIDFKTLKNNKNSILRKEIKDYICADLFHLPFRNKEIFDTIICDPPYKYYNRFTWIQELAKRCKYRLILSSPAIDIKIGKEWNRDLYYITNPGVFLRLFWVFTKENSLIKHK
jgi:SAM-dependent methyltransferase